MKRKYTRKVSTDSVQSKSSLSQEESSTKLSPATLPSDILASIELAVVSRKRLGLPDDREERIERALRYQEFIRGRNG